MRALITALVFALPLAVPALAADSAQITVTGEGRVEAPPDMATLSLGVTTAAATAAEAVEAKSAQLATVLEQLRALENGIPITVIDVDYRGRTHWSIDAPEDVPAAEAIIRREGELA